MEWATFLGDFSPFSSGHPAFKSAFMSGTSYVCFVENGKGYFLCKRSKIYFVCYNVKKQFRKLEVKLLYPKLSGTDALIFKIFSPKNLAKILAFFAQTTASFSKKCDHNIGFEKNAIFSAENWQKPQIIVIITSTPGVYC
jgi:hypothetical protein